MSEAVAPVYLDHAASTPVAPEVIAQMLECLGAEGDFANPSARSHAPGRRAAVRIEAARAQVAALVHAQPPEIVFTSGATEANNLAVFGRARACDRGHLVTTRLEHRALADPVRRLEREGWSVSWIAPDRSGRIDPEAIAAALRPDTRLASVILVSNEIGTVQDLEAIGAACRARGVPLHTDASQAAGRIELDLARLPVEFASLSAHKLYGPKGIGALYVRQGARSLLQPVGYGGGQEGGLRPGTLPTHQIAGFGAAAELAGRLRAGEQARQGDLRARLLAALAPLGGVHLNGAAAAQVPDIVSLSIEDVDGESLIAGLPELALAAGSACNSGQAEASAVLRALGHDAVLARATLRLSPGRGTGPEDIDRAAAAIRREVVRQRTDSPARAGDPGPARLVGEGGGPLEEVWVRFSVELEGDRVKSARVQVRGCPHTRAACEHVRASLVGRRHREIAPGTPREWARTLEVPVEKLGRLLVVEDALRACLAGWPRA